MTANDVPERPAVLDNLTETQFDELDFQADEYDFEQFLRLGEKYGWNEETTRQVLEWFQVRPKYPLEGTRKAE